MRGAAHSEGERDGGDRNSRRLHFPSLQPVQTGMPELCRAGLSENWLLKACGHRHWLALAKAHGLARPEFRDSDGARLYPAFTHVRIGDARLEAVGENRQLDFAVTLMRASRTRFRSEIVVTSDGVPAATVTLETTFVRRAIDGSNRSTCRAVVAGPSLLIPQQLDPVTLRGPEWDTPAALASVTLDPSPQEDFNGVGFLYFAAFQAMIDRAEWHWFRHADPVLATRARDITFLANAELGDRIVVTLRADARQAQDHVYRTELSRQSDGAVIARAVTRRGFIPG